MKIAIFCPNWVGDVVMATPALRAVRRQYPDAEIYVVAHSEGTVVAWLRAESSSHEFYESHLRPRPYQWP